MSLQRDPKFLVTGKVRLSYVYLTEPQQPKDDGKSKYSTAILIPKSDVATKQKIDAAIEAAAQEGVGKAYNGIRPPKIAIPIHDGDLPRESTGMPYGDECKGCWVMTASSITRPEVVDSAKQKIIDPNEIYSGMYAYVSLRMYPYNNNGKKGVACGLSNVMKIAEGERLGGRTTADDDFAGVDTYEGF